MQVRGVWAAQSGKCPTFDLGSGHDLRVSRPSPVLGSALSMESEILSSSAPPPEPAHVHSLLKINK